MRADECPKEGSVECEEMKTVPYRQAIGCLLYLSLCTRPDIALAVQKLAKVVQNPARKHWNLAKRVFRYLRGTTNFGLVMSKTGEGRQATLVGYVDASYGDVDNARRATTGYLFKYGNSVVSWASYVQKSVALATTEAEYMALSDATREAIWLRTVFNDLDDEQSAVILYEDNQGCIDMTKNSSGYRRKRSKHIDIRYQFAKLQVELGVVEVRYCPTLKMIADLLTKPIESVGQFQRLRNLMGVKNI